MEAFQILCVTMNQTDFSKIEQMNIHADVVFANQCDRTAYEECEFGGYKAKMISTKTKGVGVNRNLALLYASAEICLFADDDVVYDNDMKERVLAEFDAHPDADIIIFHLDTDSERTQIKYPKTKKCGRFSRMPWGAVRIAFRLNSVRKANVWFTTLFGGGCVFPSGEDSMWLNDAKRKGLTFYVSKETIGTVDMSESSWFTGYDENFFFGKGAFCEAVHPRTFFIWKCYFALRMRNHRTLKLADKIKWMNLGREGYRKMKPFDWFVEK